MQWTRTADIPGAFTIPLYLVRGEASCAFYTALFSMSYIVLANAIRREEYRKISGEAMPENGKGDCNYCKDAAQDGKEDTDFQAFLLEDNLGR